MSAITTTQLPKDTFRTIVSGECSDMRATTVNSLRISEADANLHLVLDKAESLQVVELEECSRGLSVLCIAPLLIETGLHPNAQPSIFSPLEFDWKMHLEFYHRNFLASLRRDPVLVLTRNCSKGVLAHDIERAYSNAAAAFGLSIYQLSWSWDEINSVPCWFHVMGALKF